MLQLSRTLASLLKSNSKQPTGDVCPSGDHSTVYPWMPLLLPCVVCWKGGKSKFMAKLNLLLHSEPSCHADHSLPNSPKLDTWSDLHARRAWGLATPVWISSQTSCQAAVMIECEGRAVRAGHHGEPSMASLVHWPNSA